MNKQEIEKAWQRVCLWIGCTPKEETDTHEICQTIKKALEKQIPKKLKSKKYIGSKVFYCPNDNRRVGESSEYGDIEGFKYCPGCGQKLDWRNADE